MAHIFKIIGLMSGTSCDGIDVAYIETDGINTINLGKGVSIPYGKAFADDLINLTKGDKTKLSLIEKTLTELHAQAAHTLLEEIGLTAKDIDLIGFHGHTIEHDISKKLTTQIGDLNLLAKLTGVTVVGDFRSNDVLNGGQGAPLVPIYLKAISNNLPKPILFLNIGGVANLTFISNDALIGFDTGTGNALVNDAMHACFNKSFDDSGKIAKSGTVNNELMKKWMSHPYFDKTYPKSLDRNDFSTFYQEAIDNLKAEDAVATLSYFSCMAVAKAISMLPEKCENCYVSGGGRHNSYMINTINDLAGINTLPIEKLRFDGDYLEAYAFGYLAARSFQKLPITFPSTTNVANPLTGGRVVKAA
jgi:anhydro-N-acetylmuramic acid kinase